MVMLTAAEKLLRCKTQTNTYDITGHASYQYDPYLSAQKRHHGNEERVLIPGAISKHPPEQFTINSVHYELVSSSGQFCVYALTYPPEIKIIGYDIWEHIGRYIYWCESWDKKESTIKRIEAMTTAGGIL